MKGVFAVIGQIIWNFLMIFLARADSAKDAKLKADAKAQERINDADLGIGAADSANIDWLHKFRDKHSR